MTFYLFHPLINTDDANTVIAVFGQFWENGSSEGGGGTVLQLAAAQSARCTPIIF